MYGVTLALQGEYSERPQRINEVRRQASGCGQALQKQHLPACPPNAAPLLPQLRIGGIVRKDSQQEHPAFPGQRSYPASRVAAVALDIARGQRREEIVRLHLDRE